MSWSFLNKKPDAEKITKEESERIMKGHMENITRLAKEDKLIAAGPFEGGGGIFVLNTGVCRRGEPMVEHGSWRAGQALEYRCAPFYMREGGVCHAKEPYEMVAYNLIRYRANGNQGNGPGFSADHSEAR